MPVAIPEMDRAVSPISMNELERRWSAVRAAMTEQNIDALVMQGFNEFIGGYVKYFTDIPARNGYPDTVVFPREGEMIVVRHGPRGGVIEGPALDATADRGVEKMLSANYFASVHYCKNYDGELVACALKPRGCKTIGLVGMSMMSAAFCEYLKGGNIPGAQFVDATDLVDRIQVIKSAEEIECIKKTALLQDAAMEAAVKAVRPGARDFEVLGAAQHAGNDLGSEQGIYLGCSAPMGLPARLRLRHFQGREIREGDQVAILVENNGPGGFYTELGRTAVAGKASQEMLDDFEIILEAQRNTLSLMTPGTPAREIYEAHNAFMRSRGRPEEQRIYAHGQGYNLVERPLIRDDEPMNIEAGMSMTVHPMYVTETLFGWVCDNYLITENGPGECIHKTPQKIFEV
ncbi:MAG: M24 family metallopeptidase [bacterium]